MFKFLTLGVLSCCGLMLVCDEAQAGRRRCCCGGGAPAPVVVPAPAPPVAPPAPTAAAPQATRTYSYEPDAYTSDWFGGSRSGRAYENAANKSLGRGF